MPMSHRCWRPEAHQKHRPQAGMKEAATWSPTARVSTLGPTSAHDPRALVPADHREHRLHAEDLEHLGRSAHVAGTEVLVGMAHAGIGHLDHHFVRTRGVDVDLFDLPRLFETGTDGGTDLHTGGPPLVSGPEGTDSLCDQHRTIPTIARRAGSPPEPVLVEAGGQGPEGLVQGGGEVVGVVAGPTGERGHGGAERGAGHRLGPEITGFPPSRPAANSAMTSHHSA